MSGIVSGYQVLNRPTRLVRIMSRNVEKLWSGLEHSLRLEHDLMSRSWVASCCLTCLMTASGLLLYSEMMPLVCRRLVVLVVQPDDGKHNGRHVELATRGGGQQLDSLDGSVRRQGRQ